METKQPFKILSKICLNNWHYIDRKILTLNEGINFFTGHSGSGKSTVIDALQIVLYANTDGRGFFNKAAADDSDRTLIEYLRGMVNISENNESQYLRNRNFSSTIVLELTQSNTKEKQCIGVVFDVETASNEIGRLFFWHMGGLLENQYRTQSRCLSTTELREYLQRTFSPEQFYCGSSNERFRRQMYDIYLGGLDGEKFPRLFKRAIPFRMNIKLEEFVKEYICMEQDIHIEDLQESVMQYGRMQGKIEETLAEIQRLESIGERYGAFREKRREVEVCNYQIGRLEMLQLEGKIQEFIDKEQVRQEGIVQQEEQKKQLEKAAEELQAEYEEIILRIADSGYSGLESELGALNETLERLSGSKVRWLQTAEGLKEGRQQDTASNQMLWDIEKFAGGSISEGELERLRESFLDVQEELEGQRQEADAELRRIKREEKEAREELQALKQGKKAYPRELEEARYELRAQLHERCGKFVNVRIMADLLDIRDERWHNAVEGYLGNNKLLLIVEPEYAKAALDIYRQMDRKKYCRVSVLDTEKVLEAEAGAREGSLAKEVVAKEPYVQAYIDFFLGNVMKCESVEELRECRIGVTPDCVLYQGFRMQHMNPDSYTKRAYIGETSMRQRIRKLEEYSQKLQEERIPVQQLLTEIKKSLQLEMLKQPIGDYMGWLADMKEIPAKERRKKQITEKMLRMKEESVDAWEKQKTLIQEKQQEKKDQIRKAEQGIWESGRDIENLRRSRLAAEEALREQRRSMEEYLVQAESSDIKRAEDGQQEDTYKGQMWDPRYEQGFQEYLSGRRTSNYEYLKRQQTSELQPKRKKEEEAYQQLVEERSSYLRSYPNRTFSAAVKDNEPYEKLLENLKCDELEAFRESAKEQARSAVEHFKEDFILKIRSAIVEAVQRKDELNRVISRLDFGKDKYQFVITKNKGADGRYYKMFMDENLKVHPSQLTNHIDHQMNMFTMEHENQYGDMINELINIFIPPEHAGKEEMEEARKNMDKYADYRTYLSFDMQQIVRGDKDMTIGLGKMIKKNSGGEGQNPLYVALLASFAQVYRINLSPKIHRAPTLRLVVLDEAFSKMDAEKVASCISLIRGLGFQAVISATNDKIQNYLENVDKTFVYANPNKKHISIQEFEKVEFGELEENAGEE